MQDVSPNNKDIIFLAAILLLFVFTRFIGIDAQSLWVDEINLARIADEIKFSGNITADLIGFFQIIKTEPHPPFYFIISKIWVSIFGASITALRSLSIVWITLLLVLLGGWSRKEFGFRFTCLLLLLFAFSPTIFHESQHFRPYTFSMLMGGAIGCAYFHFLQNTNLRWRLAPVCALVMIATLSHYSAVIFALAVAGHQFLYGILTHPKNYIRWFLNSIIIMLAVLPALFWYGATFQSLYLRHVGDLAKSRDIFDYISVFRAFTGFPGLVLVLILPLAGGSDSILQNGRIIIAKLAKDHIFIVCLAISVLHYVLVTVTSFAQPSMLQNKNFLIAFPLGLIALTRYIMVFADDLRVYRLAITLGAIGFITYLVTGYPHHKVSYFHPWREQVREVADLIQQDAKPGDIVLFGTVSMNGYALQPTKIYLTLIEGRPNVLNELEVANFPPAITYIIDQRNADIEQRQALLLEALAKIQRDPLKRLFIDLPHNQLLSQTEADMLVKSGFCVQVTDFAHERLMVIENTIASAICVNWAKQPELSRAQVKTGDR